MAQESTKGKILKSAYTLFRQEGFTRVSVDAIADQAGVTKRTVYYHFESKDDIVADVLKDQHEYPNCKSSMISTAAPCAWPGGTQSGDPPHPA